MFSPGDRVRVLPHAHMSDQCSYVGEIGTVVYVATQFPREPVTVDLSVGRSSFLPSELELATTPYMTQDQFCQASYLHLLEDTPVSLTVEARVNVDLSDSGEIIGIEFLSWPLLPITERE